jgi:hypothetical protein
MLSEETLVNSFATELVDEAVGASPRKWAIVLVALVLGAGIALWFVRRRSGGGDEIASDITPVPATPSGAAVVGG